MKHLNPRQGITTCTRGIAADPGLNSVKHLNPRQGITTGIAGDSLRSGTIVSVKHLNPRQGITTQRMRSQRVIDITVGMCETPKSPPGDYNYPPDSNEPITLKVCETPKSPPGDYNKNAANCMPPARHTVRLKHLNPRQGITTSDV